jgi:protease-4
VEAIAQGRVWLGQDAFKHKLVDQLGSLDDAIAKAAKLAKLDKYYTSKYPDMPDMFDQLLASSEESKGNYLDEAMQATLGDLYEPFLMLRYINNQAPIQARLPFVLNVR